MDFNVKKAHYVFGETIEGEIFSSKIHDSAGKLHPRPWPLRIFFLPRRGNSGSEKLLGRGGGRREVIN